MNKLKIVIVTALAAVAYGILHDQITARLCIEYFTVAHPPLFSATSPTVVAVCWGITATVGFGVILGLILANIAHAGNMPPTRADSLRRPLAKLLASMAIAASTAGLCGYLLARNQIIPIPDGLRSAIPVSRHHLFIAVWFAHCASYIAGLGSGSYIAFRIWKKRGRPFVFALVPSTPAATIRAIVLVIVTGYIIWLRLQQR